MECGSEKSVKMNFNTLKILHYISKLNCVAHGVKFGVLEPICTYVSEYTMNKPY